MPMPSLHLPSFELPTFKGLNRGSSVSSPLSRTSSPRGTFSNMSDSAADPDPSTTTDAEPAATTDDAPPADEEKEADVLDMRQHDEMIRDTLKTLSSTSVQRTNVFGLLITRPPESNGRLRVAIRDEVRFGLWLGLLILLVTGLIFLIVVAVRDDVQFSDTTNHPHATAIIIAGIFALLACFVTAFQLYMHWKNWSHAPSQKLIIRILLMVPVYAISSWVALLELEYSTYIDFVRVCYEAFTLYTFMVLLTQYLGGHEGVVEWMKYKEPIPWVMPLNCLPRCEPTSNFLWYLKYSCLQYAVLAPIAMFVAVICESFHAYGDGEFNLNQGTQHSTHVHTQYKTAVRHISRPLMFSPCSRAIVLSSGYLYVTILINCTQLVSLYALAWLYVIMRKELNPFSPVTKFACIKGVVFFTFWQGVGLAVLVKVGAISETENFSTGEVQVGLQDFIICIEMFIFACCHKYAFGYETYSDGSLALLMEQRSTFITQLTYKRAVDEARRELEERERQNAVVHVPQHEHVYEKTTEHKVEIVPEKDTYANELTTEEKDEIVKARALEIFAHNHSDEEVLGDDKAMRRQLPNSASESQRERNTNGDERRQEGQLIDQEMTRETSTSGQRIDSEDLLHDSEES